VFRAVIISNLFIIAHQQQNQQQNSLFLSFFSKQSHFNSLHIAFLSPFFFGIAHIHHFVLHLKNKQSMMKAIFTTLFQLSFTSVFGVIAALVFMRTGSIYSSIVCHILCNFVGLPNLGFMFPNKDYIEKYYENYEKKQGKIIENSAVSDRIKNDNNNIKNNNNKKNNNNNNKFNYSKCNELSCLYNYRYFLLFLHGLGLILFSYFLFYLTEDFSKSSIYWQK
jgi:hypothetical protein